MAERQSFGHKFLKKDIEELRKLAKKTRRSVASFINEAIELILKKYDIQNKKRS